MVFAKAQVPVIKARCEEGYRDEYKKMVAWANREVESVLSGDFAKAFKAASEKKQKHQREKTLYNLCSSRSQTFGLLWHLTGEKRYAEAGKRVLSLMLSPRKAFRGYNLFLVGREMDAAAAYDLFYDTLSPEERTTYGKRLLKCIPEKRSRILSSSFALFEASL